MYGALASLCDGWSYTAAHINQFCGQIFAVPRKVELDGVTALAASIPSVLSGATMPANHLKQIFRIKFR